MCGYLWHNVLNQSYNLRIDTLKWKLCYHECELIRLLSTIMRGLIMLCCNERFDINPYWISHVFHENCQKTASFESKLKILLSRVFRKS